MIDENDFAAGLYDAGEFIERRFRIRHNGDDILRDDDVEDRISETEMLRIHHGKSVDIGQPVLGDARLRLAQHRRREIDTDQAVRPGIAGQGQAGADTDLENAAADALRRLDRSFAAALEHRAEYEIVDRGPAGIGFGDTGFIEFVRHRGVSANRGHIGGALHRGGGNGAVNDAAAEHARLAIGCVVKHASLAR